MQRLRRVECVRSSWVGCGDEGTEVHRRRGDGARVRVVGSGRGVYDAPLGRGGLLYEQEARRGGRGWVAAADRCVGSAVVQLRGVRVGQNPESGTCDGRATLDSRRTESGRCWAA